VITHVLLLALLACADVNFLPKDLVVALLQPYLPLLSLEATLRFGLSNLVGVTAVVWFFTTDTLPLLCSGGYFTADVDSRSLLRQFLLSA
jgi:hypothetical protein